MADKELHKLMEQVVKSNDPELMKMMTQLLQQQSEGSGNTEPTKEEIKKAEEKFPEFTMNRGKEDKVGGVPVNKMPRENKFVDDGKEHQDEGNKTPKVEATERRRPAFKKVDQTCTRCNSVNQVHPQFARDFYVCDKCLRR